MKNIPPILHKKFDFLCLFLLTAAALLVQGYHPFAEDAEIYLPGVERILHPNLFPAGREFFESHASLTLFPNLIALSLRVTHLPFQAGLFLWQVASIFLFLLACWELSGLLFPNNRKACWGGICLVAALLTIPVAGTALYIMDQYLNPRNLAACGEIFMLVRTLEKKYLRAFLWLVFAACMHPLMWVFPFSFCVLLPVMDYCQPYLNRTFTTATLMVLWMPLTPAASAAYHEASKRHGFHYIQRWQWYEIVGAVAPIALFWWFTRISRGQASRDQLMHAPGISHPHPPLERVSRAFVVYSLIYLVMALALDLPARFEALARIQPLRSLHFLYIVMFIVIGGFLAEYILRTHIWLWLLLFVPLGLGMFFAQRSLFPASAHIEWPGAQPKNPWAQAFLWINQNAPVDVVFALDPEYMAIPGEDENGFRCRAQRSRLADDGKDNGVVSMFPSLADEWWAQVQAQTPWNALRIADFQRLKNEYGATWVVVQQSGVSGLNCVYQNSAVQICRIP